MLGKFLWGKLKDAENCF
uniref:Uncharacterized protein n=1 Tax=Rhizophora mucronata TaxID=61149 RepID=A0A2P2NN81_RHIMU